MELVADHITKIYNGHTAIRDVSLTLTPGRVTGLLGPNGAGKTTFIRILNRIISADSGSVQIDGHPLSAKHIAHIGYLPEERGLYKKMRVLSHILYLARLRGLDKHEATRSALDWLEKLGLAQWKQARIEQLSKGMAQKVQFISTIIHQPGILILDEPFSGFDPVNANLIKQEILALREAGTTIMLSTHNMNSVEEICDDIVLINEGRAMLSGKIDEVKAAHRAHIYEIEFKGNIIGFTNALWAGYELLDRKQLGNEHFSVRLKLLNENTLNQLLTTVIPHVQIERVQEVVPSMSDIFLQTIQPKADA